MILRTLYTAREVESTVHRLAIEITRDHAHDIGRLADPATPPAGGKAGPTKSGRGRKRSREAAASSTLGSGAAAAPASGPADAPAVAARLLLPAGAGITAGARDEVTPSLSLERPVLVGVLKGTFVFLADLVRAMKVPADVDFVRARLSGRDMHPDRIQFDYEPEHSLAGRSVVIVEDVAGTGRTLAAVLARLKAHEPRTLRVCALVMRRGYTGPPVDYVGFEVGPGWLVGYGLDDREAYRNLPGLCVLED